MTIFYQKHSIIKLMNIKFFESFQITIFRKMNVQFINVIEILKLMTLGLTKIVNCKNNNHCETPINLNTRCK